MIHNQDLRQQETLIRLVGALQSIGTIKGQKSLDMGFGTRYIKVDLEVDGVECQVDFFVPANGGQIYRHGERDSTGIFKQHRIQIEDCSNCSILKALAGSSWMNLNLLRGSADA